jgi:hypothetical protein
MSVQGVCLALWGVFPAVLQQFALTVNRGVTYREAHVPTVLLLAAPAIQLHVSAAAWATT